MKQITIYIFFSGLVWLTGLAFRIVQDKNELYVFVSDRSKILTQKSLSQGVIKRGNFYIFTYVLANNLTVLLLAIAGFGTLGTSSFTLLFLNGFNLADSILLANKNGLPIYSFIKYILPHSFEIVALWIGAAISFRILFYTYQFINNIVPSKKEISYLYKLGTLAFLITFLAAFVEAYVTYFLVQ